MSMNLTTTIKLANGESRTYSIDFSALPVSSQEAIAAYGFARKINDTGNSAGARAKDEGGDQSAAKLSAANAIHAAILSGTIGTTQRGPRVDEWQAEARAYAAKTAIMVSTLRGIKTTADRHRILDAFILKNDAKLRPAIDNIIAAKAPIVEADFDF